MLRCLKAWLCSQISDPLSLYNVRTRWLEEIRAHSRAPVLLCGCMADLRTDENTVAHLGRLGRSVVSLDQALAISSQMVKFVPGVTLSARRGIFFRASFSLVRAVWSFARQGFNASPRLKLLCLITTP